ncbi:MAG: adenylyltransferase/cytidyltransferase family protein, partial [Candidatus Magasanikbacteria bacterium]
MTKVMVFGTFDIIHPGHLYLLTEAKKLGDFLTVVIARDQTVAEVKGKTAKHNEIVRLKNISELQIADKVILGNDGDKYQVIKEEKPDIIALGYDQRAFVDKLDGVLDKKFTI